jgi:hypothetical protein
MRAQGASADPGAVAAQNAKVLVLLISGIDLSIQIFTSPKR